MSQDSSPEAVLEHHVQAMIQGDVDVVLQDYTDESVIITQNATYKGLNELRQFFTEVLKIAPEGFWDAFTITRQEVSGEVIYDVWEAQPWFPCGTDTLLIRNGKILVQTGAMCVPSSIDV